MPQIDITKKNNNKQTKNDNGKLMKFATACLANQSCFTILGIGYILIDI